MQQSINFIKAEFKHLPKIMPRFESRRTCLGIKCDLKWVFDLALRSIIAFRNWSICSCCACNIFTRKPLLNFLRFHSSFSDRFNFVKQFKWYIIPVPLPHYLTCHRSPIKKGAVSLTCRKSSIQISKSFIQSIIHKKKFCVFELHKPKGRPKYAALSKEKTSSLLIAKSCGLRTLQRGSEIYRKKIVRKANR